MPYRSQQEIEARNHGYATERFWAKYADKWYHEYIFPLLRKTRQWCNNIDINRFKHNGSTKKSEWDYDTARQVYGADGYFLLTGPGGREEMIYFEEKFSNKSLGIGKWGAHEWIEIVGNGGHPGWGCGLKDVRFLFFHHPDKSHYLDGVDGLVDFSKCLYDEWVKRGRNYATDSISVTHPNVKKPMNNQDIFVNTYDDANNKKKWKMITCLTEYGFSAVGKYCGPFPGLEKYK